MPPGCAPATMVAMSTYAVSWLNSTRIPCAGSLAIDREGLKFIGGSKGHPVSRRVRFDDIEGVEIESGLLRVTKRDGHRLTIESLDAPGALRELAERLAGGLD